MAALVAAGCKPKDYFPAYHDGDNLANLISDKTFAVDWGLDPELEAMGPSSAWYLGWEEATDSEVPEGPDAERPEVYRLEVKSLFPDGDFSGATVGAVTLGNESEGWRFDPPTAVGGTGTHEIVDGTHQYAIMGNTLHFETTTNAARLDFPIRDPVYGAADGFLEDGSYLVRFRYRSGATYVVFEFRDATDPITRWALATAADLDELLQFPDDAIIDEYDVIRPRGAADYYLSFGTVETPFGNVQLAYVDDFRMVRTDLPPHAELRLPHELTLPISGSQGESFYTLESGEYRFVVWIHDDPTVDTVGNRYAAAALELKITGGDLGGSSGSTAGTVTTTKLIARGADGAWIGDEGVETVNGWTQVSIETPSMQLAAPVNPADPVLLISIAPTDYAGNGGLNYDAGSILLSAPSLGFLTAVLDAPP